MGASQLSVFVLLDTHLVVLDLSRNGLRTEGAMFIARALSGGSPNKTLRKLYLADNNIDSSAPELWELLFSVSTLSLHGNRDIRNAGARDIAATLERVSQIRLSKLDLSDCGIKQAGAEAVLVAATGCKLMELHLDKNDFVLRMDGAGGADVLEDAAASARDRRKTARITGNAIMTVPAEHAVESASMALLLRSVWLTSVTLPMTWGPDTVEGELLRTVLRQNAAFLALLRDRKREDAPAAPLDGGILSFKSRMWRTVPEDLFKVNWITLLDLRRNLLQGIPFSLTRFRALTALDISYNCIEADSVPVHLQRLTRLVSLNVEGNPFVTWEPKATGAQPAGPLCARMCALGEERVPCDQIKAIVVGQEAVGKSTLIDTLCRSLNDESAVKHKFFRWRKRLLERRDGRQWTDGIDLLQATLTQSDPAAPPLTLTLWDFAGQAVYYPTHQFFLPEHAVFIVCFDLTVASSMARVHYWLDSLAAKVKGADVLLVGTHRDKCPTWEAVLETVRVRHASRRDVRVRACVAVRATQMADMAPIKQALQQCAATSLKDWVGRMVPRSYQFLASVIREQNALMRRPVMAYADFADMAHACGVGRAPAGDAVAATDGSALDACLAWLTYVGAVLRFPSLPALRDQIFLNPTWLVSVMSRLVTWRPDALVAVGTFEEKDIPTLWPAKFFPEHLRETILSLLTSMEILHPLSESGSSYVDPNAQRTFVVPCMLPEDEPVTVIVPPFPGHVYERVFAFSFAPFGLFPQLLIRMMGLCSMHLRLWKWGLVAVMRAAHTRHLVRFVGAFDGAGAGEVTLTITTSDTSGLVLHVANSPLESLLRACYPSVKPTRYVVRREGPISERISTDFFATDAAGDLGAVLAPDLALGTTLRVLPAALTLQREIARGAYGIVYGAEYEGRRVVAKQLLESETSTAYQELLRECWMMSFLDHAHIIRLIGVVVSPLTIVMELMNGGDLRAFLTEHHASLSPFVQIKLLIDVASGMNYAHTQNPPVIHMDLKSPNVLVHRSPEGVLTAKVADLGLATVFAYSLKHEAADNPRWVAPEAIRGEKISRKVDVYSFSIIMWEMQTGRFPFDDSEQRFPFTYQFANAIAREGLRPTLVPPPRTGGLPRAFTTLMIRSWADDPALRPTFMEMLQHLNLMLENMAIPPLYGATQPVLSQMGTIGCASMAYVDQTLVLVDETPADAQLVVLHSDGLLVHHQLLDGHVRATLHLPAATAIADDNFHVKFSMCAVRQQVYLCDSITSRVLCVSPDGRPLEGLASQLMRVTEVVASGDVVFVAGLFAKTVSGVEFFTVGGPRRHELTALEELVSGHLFGGVAGAPGCAWYVCRPGPLGLGTSVVVADAKAATLRQLDLHRVAAPDLSLLVVAGTEVWALGSEGRVWVWQLAGAEGPPTSHFTLPCRVLMAVYAAHVRRVVAVTEDQELVFIHPRHHTLVTAVTRVPVQFCPGSKALLYVPPKLSQVVVGGESLMLYKCDAIMHTTADVSAAVPARKARALPAVRAPADSATQMRKSSIAMRPMLRAPSMHMTEDLDAVLRDLIGGMQREPGGPPARPLPSTPALDPEGSLGDVLVVGAGVSSPTPTPALGDDADENGESSGGAAPSASALAEESTRLGELLEALQKPLQPKPLPRSPPSTPSAATATTTTTTKSPILPVRTASSSSVAASKMPRKSPSSSSMFGSSIRRAYNVNERVKISVSPPNDPYPFRVTLQSGPQIGWGNKQRAADGHSECVFMDMIGNVVHCMPFSELEAAKRGRQSRAGSTDNSDASRAPPPRRAAQAVRSNAPQPRLHLVSNADLRGLVARFVARHDALLRQVQCRVWLALAASSADAAVRCELLYKLHFEFVRPAQGPAVALPLAELAAALEPVAAGTATDIGPGVLDRALAQADAVLVETLLQPFVAHAKARLQAMDAQLAADPLLGAESSMIRHAGLYNMAAKITFDELVLLADMVASDEGDGPASGVSTPRKRGEEADDDADDIVIGARAPPPQRPAKAVPSAVRSMCPPTQEKQQPPAAPRASHPLPQTAGPQPRTKSPK